MIAERKLYHQSSKVKRFLFVFQETLRCVARCRPNLMTHKSITPAPNRAQANEIRQQIDAKSPKTVVFGGFRVLDKFS